MSNERFTKGPWIIDGYGNIVQKTDGKSDARGCIRARGLALTSADGEPGYNAALIAAAPEMYEMLKKLMAHYNFSEYCENEIDALLTKARGE